METKVEHILSIGMYYRQVQEKRDQLLIESTLAMEDDSIK